MSENDVVRIVVLALLYLIGCAIVLLLLAALGFAFLILASSHKPALAQHNHAEHHAHYQNWVNKDNKGCCNDQDCGTLNDADERTSRGFQEVRIEGVWCPVEPKHYLKSGNAPDASTSHVCVWHRQAQPALSICERLLCYQPKPGI